MRQLVLYSLLLAFTAGCSQEGVDCMDIDTGISVMLRDSEAQDLLNPNTPNHISREMIKMFYENDGKRTTYAETANGSTILDNPEGFRIDVDENNQYRLFIYSNSTPGSASVTILSISGRPETKIVTEVVQSECGVSVKKIWIDDKLMWPIDANKGKPKIISIVLPD